MTHEILLSFIVCKIKVLFLKPTIGHSKLKTDTHFVYWHIQFDAISFIMRDILNSLLSCTDWYIYSIYIHHTIHLIQLVFFSFDSSFSFPFHNHQFWFSLSYRNLVYRHFFFTSLRFSIYLTHNRRPQKPRNQKS